MTTLKLQCRPIPFEFTLTSKEETDTTEYVLHDPKEIVIAIAEAGDSPLDRRGTLIRHRYKSTECRVDTLVTSTKRTFV